MIQKGVIEISDSNISRAELKDLKSIFLFPSNLGEWIPCRMDGWNGE